VAERYKSDLEEATSKLNDLLVFRETLEARIAKQKKIVAALRELVKSDEEVPTGERLVDGITDACRTVLRAAGRPLLPIEVRDGVQMLGLPPQENLLASVYTVLRRLKQSGEVLEDFDTHRNPGGSAVMAYRWADPISKLGYPNPTNTQKR
jgi:NADPH-dependent ferric siderophore reductase